MVILYNELIFFTKPDKHRAYLGKDKKLHFYNKDELQSCIVLLPNVTVKKVKNGSHRETR